MPLGGGSFLGNVGRPEVRPRSIPNITNQWGYSGQDPFASGFTGANAWNQYGISQDDARQSGYTNPYQYYLNNPQATYYNYGSQNQLGNYLRNWFPRFTWQPPQPAQPKPFQNTDAGQTTLPDNDSQPWVRPLLLQGGSDITPPTPPNNGYNPDPDSGKPQNRGMQGLSSPSPMSPMTPNNGMRMPNANINQTPYTGRLGSLNTGISRFRRGW